MIRNAAVPAAQFGPMAFIGLVLLGFFLQMPALIWVGIASYALVFVFQLVNLPVEFDASHRAKLHLAELGMVDAEGAAAVSSVLNAAALTYVAATLQSLLTVLYYAVRLGGLGSRDE
jgi:Zn-dependent membrane protease YugP